jgi:hypothetical protein
MTMKKIAINVFIVCHLSFIFCWALPLNTGILTNLRPKIAPYMVWSGLAQGWNLFAPNPLSLNSRLEAEISYSDGQKGVWKFPLPQNYGYIKRYTLERQHKFSLDSLLNNKFALLRPDAARYIARLNNKGDNRPVSVTFVSYRSQIAPPGSNQPEPWTSTVIGTYPISAGDLQ